MIYHIKNHSIGFSIKSIKNEYSNKEKFFNAFFEANKEIEKKDMEKVLEKVWKEAFHFEEKKEKGAE